MEITYKTLSKMWEHPDFQNAGFDYADEYGEPGYSLPYGASNDVGVLLANWWCSCGRVLERFDYGASQWTTVGADDPTAPGERRAKLHGFDHHYPRLFAQLEEQGYQLEWSDEWVVTHEGSPSKCYRTQPDSYSWQSSILWTDGDFLTPDDGIDAWLEELVNDPRRCMTSVVWSRRDLAEAGFVQYERDDPKQYESGWHPGQTDDPEEITREIRAELGDDVDILFYLDGSGQFDVRFSAWTRGDGQHFHAGHNIPGYLPMDDGPALLMSWTAARDATIEELERYADDTASMLEDDPERATSLLASLEDAIAEVRGAERGEELYVNVCSDDAHDLGLSYWVTACAEEECSAEEE